MEQLGHYQSVDAVLRSDDREVRLVNLIEGRGLRAAIFESDRRDAIHGFWQDDQRHYVDFCLTSRPTSSRACFGDTAGQLINLGETFYVPVGWRMQVHGSAGHQRTLRLFIADDASTGELPSRSRATNHYLNVRNQEVRHSLLKISAEVLTPGFASAMLVEGLSLTVLAELLRLGSARNREQHGMGGLSSWRLRVIRESIEDGQAPPSISELAEACKLSPRHLMRAFREETGQSLGSYLATSMLLRAKERLESTGMPISQIAAEAGFSSNSSFAAAFRKSTGMSPRDYRTYRS